MTVDERDVRTLIENWAAAVRRKDYEASREHHAPDVLMFDVPPPPESRGIEAYEKTWDLFFRWSETPIGVRDYGDACDGG
jgi:ketosteroid isomerase-like protein